ncbi:MAG: TadE/TadG family type IV pilus assembly protein [Anaerolineae bacterium]
MRRKIGEETGANVAEFALVLPLLLFLLVGVIDFGRAFYSYIAITNASREGARYASKFPSDTPSIRDAAVAEAAAGGVAVVPGNVGVTITGTSPDRTARVVVQHDVNMILGGLLAPFGIPNPIHLSSETAMAVFGI